MDNRIGYLRRLALRLRWGQRVWIVWRDEGWVVL